MSKLFSVEKGDKENRILIRFLGIKIRLYSSLKFYYYGIYKNSKFIIKLLDKLLPKDSSKVIFSSYPDFSDSAYLFYDYLKKQKQDKFKKIIWLKSLYDSNHKDIVHKKYYINTFRGLWNLLTAKYIIHDHCNMFFDYISSSRHVCFNVWHGSPIKTIGHGDSSVTCTALKRYNYMAKNTYMFVSSDIFKLIFSSMFQINPNKIFITGIVRTDIIFQKGRESYIKDCYDINKFSKVVLFAPTYKKRNNGKVDVELDFENLFGFEDYNKEDFINYLKENNICLLIKPHPFEEKQFVKFLQDNNYDSVDNLRIITWKSLTENSININELFSVTDLIVSDFSSITVDYAISNKPILYLYNYLESYKTGRGFILQDNFELLMPGQTVSNFSDLKNKISKCLAAKTANYTKEEVNVLYKYIDGNSCERIFEIMKGL